MTNPFEDEAAKVFEPHPTPLQLIGLLHPTSLRPLYSAAAFWRRHEQWRPDWRHRKVALKGIVFCCAFSL
jgi:hypothetical protein